MDPFTSPLTQTLPAYGPWLLFVLALLETSFVTGLLVPAGVATSLGTVLALEGSLDVRAVVAAALAGGALGDSLGFWVGRVAGAQVFAGKGRVGRFAAQRRKALSPTLERHPAVSVSLARVISFVRTLMPMVAGMSGLSYRRFLAYEIPGLAACVGLYVAIGILTRGSWHLAVRLLGLGGALLTGVAVVLLWLAWRRRGHGQGRGHRSGAGVGRAP